MESIRNKCFKIIQNTNLKITFSFKTEYFEAVNNNNVFEMSA